MKSFDQYAAIKDLAESILDHEIDVDQFCESILSNIEENGIDNLDEGIMDGFSRAVGGIARGVSGVAGMPFGMAKDAGSAANRAATRVGQNVAGYGMQAMDKARSMGRSAYDRASSATQAVGKYASDKYAQASDYADRTGKAISSAGKKVGQYAGDKYQQSARVQAVKQIEGRLLGLRDAMSALGISPNQINGLLRTANKIVLQSGHELSPNIQSSFAPQAPRRGIGGRFASGS